MHGDNDGNSLEELNGYDDGNGCCCSVAISVRDVLLLILEADKYPRLGNEDWPVAAALEREALERAKTSVPSADDPPAYQRWL